jgi:predicted MPP superfamily phosphohydrolase
MISRSPSDRFYKAIHWTFMSMIALIALHGFVLARWIPTPRFVGFRLIVGSMLAMNILWWSIADRRFSRHIAGINFSRSLRILAAVFSIALNVPIVYMIFAGRMPRFLDTTPTWYSAAVTLWQLCLIAFMPTIAGLRLLWLGAFAFARKIRPPAVTECDPQRRALLKTAFATAPITLLAGGVAISHTQERRLQINRRRVDAPWLPQRLKGLTITHISDLHVGRLYRPRMLPQMVEAANSLNSDLVIITGDIVDVSNDMLDPALDAIGQLVHRHGLFLCIGNHDEIDNRPEFIRRVRNRFPLLLINQRRSLQIDGEPLTIAGVDFASSDEPIGWRRSHLSNVAATLQNYDRNKDGPVIAMAHHPHTWDCLADAGVPLTLSGHTHGGQIMFTPAGDPREIGAGQILFRYNRGLYRKKGTSLFVNSGVGNWFPLRLNAPAEVVQLQLV